MDFRIFWDARRGGRLCPPGKICFRNAKPIGESEGSQGLAESPTPTQCGRISGQRRLPHVVLKHAQRPQAKPAAFSELRGFFLRGGGHKRVQLRFRAGGVGIKCFAGDSTRALCPGGGLCVIAGIGNVQVTFRICRRALCRAVGDDGGLRAGAGGIRGECLRVNTGNDPVFCGPEDRLIEVVAGSNVRKRHGGRLRLGRALLQPERVNCVRAGERPASLYVRDQLLRGLLRSLGHESAVLGRETSCIGGRLQGVHGDKVLIKFLLQSVKLCLDVRLVCIAHHRRAVFLYKVAHIVVENLKAPIV